jgi:hypothetical protein
MLESILSLTYVNKKSVTEVKDEKKWNSVILEKYILFNGNSIFCVNDNDQIINWPKCVETEHNFLWV